MSITFLHEDYLANRMGGIASNQLLLKVKSDCDKLVRWEQAALIKQEEYGNR